MPLEVTRTIRSVGCSIIGSGTSATRTSRLPCQVKACIYTDLLMAPWGLTSANPARPDEHQTSHLLRLTVISSNEFPPSTGEVRTHREGALGIGDLRHDRSRGALERLRLERAGCQVGCRARVVRSTLRGLSPGERQWI